MSPHTLLLRGKAPRAAAVAGGKTGKSPGGGMCRVRGWQGQCLLVEVLEAASRGEDLSREPQTLFPFIFLLSLALPFRDCCFFAKERDVRNSLVVQCLGLCFH